MFIRMIITGLTLSMLLGSGLASAAANMTLSQDCEVLLAKDLFAWDSQYEGKTGEEIGLDFAIRGQDPNDFEAHAFVMLAAAQQGYADGQYNMGVYLRDGVGVSKDIQSSICWFRLAANQGDVGAQGNLALIYFDEAELPKDIVTAHMWSVIASSSGDEWAKKIMMKIQGFMGFNQIKDGWELARVCVASKFIDCN